MPPTTEEHEQQYNSDYNDARDNNIAPAPYERLAKGGGFGNGTTSNGRGGSSMSLSMVEIGFKGKPIPTWKDQITLRSLVVSVGLGTVFGMLSIKESLLAGTLSPVNIYTSVVGYSFIKAWLMILETSGIGGQPFTRQENAIIQSCVLGITGVCFSGGLGNYLFAMGSVVAARFPIGNDPQNIKNPGTAWIMAFLFLSSFAGFFFTIPLQKYLILNLKLLYPGGHSIGVLLNTIHAPLTNKFSRKRLLTLGKFFSISFLWNCFVWMFSGTGKNCGFSTLPIFGFKARDKSFYFEFYSTHVGVGMLCPYSTSISMLIGSILSWGILYPYIRSKRGIWYEANLIDSAFDYRGFGGYRFNLGLALILGDSAFHIVKNLIARSICKSRNKGIFTTTADHNCTGHHHLPVNAGTGCSNPDRESNDTASCTNCCTDNQIRTQNFLNELIPTKIAIVCLVALVALSAILLPIIFPAVKWYYILCMYAVAFPVSFSRAHVAGLTDMNTSAHFGRLAMFIFGGWTPASHGGVLVALVACGVVMNFTSPGSQLMSDLKTGYLTLTSPRSIFVSKIFGNIVGCIISPLIFKYYTSHYPGFGTDKSPFSAAMAPYFRSGAITSLEGFKGWPMYTVHFCIAFFTAAIVINIIKELLPEKVAKYVPIPIVIGIPFYVGGYISVSFCLGGLIVFLWRMKNKAESDAYSPLVGAALICGDGMWILQESILELVSLMPPACASFVPT